MLPGDTSPPKRNILWRYLARFDEGEVVRWIFRGMLVGAVGVLALDLDDLVRTNGLWPEPTVLPDAAEPILPPAVDGGERAAPRIDPRPYLTTAEDALEKPMSFELGAAGVLVARGTIDPGAAARFSAEIDARGEYVKAVSLDSPGGALEDAMQMARVTRQKGLATEVADGALCASSCPLFFIGGVARHVGAKAAIGVHQFYAVPQGERVGPDQAMADAQETTAAISRHIGEMGVDPAFWLHALVTPPRSLYYFSPEELGEYRLVTTKAATARRKS